MILYTYSLLSSNAIIMKRNVHMYTYNLKPLIWCHFIDDNFMLWTHGFKALQDFVKHLNSCHPTPKFTFESSKVSIPMLDTTIIVGLHRKLYTILYMKPTATYSYLHYSSCHPHHQNMRIIRGNTCYFPL